MGQTLTNGIYLPSEGERNCYSGLAANWNAVDTLKGNYSLHAINVGIHVTAAEKETWNSKADASALTAHTGDTTIHVTAEDKAKWDTVTGKANDADVVHKSGNETIGGKKTFTNDLTIYNSDNTANTPSHILKNRKAVIGSTTDIGSQNIAFRDSADTNLSILKTSCESVGNTSLEIRVYNKDSNNQTVSGGMLISQTLANTYITPTTDNAVLFGSTSRRWSKIYGTEYYYGSNNIEFSTKFVTTDTAQTISGSKTFSSINGVEPSSLSLPSDRSARIDISSYFTNTGTGQGNSYTVPANGYIYLTLSELTNVHCFSRTSGNVTNYAQTFTKLSNSTGALYVLFPVRKNDVFVATWYTTTTVSVDSAFFIPCQGNV